MPSPSPRPIDLIEIAAIVAAALLQVAATVLWLRDLG